MQINKALMTAFSPIWFSNAGSNIFLKAQAKNYYWRDHEQLYFLRFRTSNLKVRALFIVTQKVAHTLQT